jgi:beta-lactamase class D
MRTPHLPYFAALIGALSAANAYAALIDHFQGRYGAIEVFDTGKKLSFRVNPPELSTPRNFCEFDNLAVAITAVEAGLVKDFVTPIDALVPDLSERERAQSATLRSALRNGNPKVFAALAAKLGNRVQQLQTSNALPTGKARSAFQILEWFKAVQAKKIALKPATVTALSSLLVQKRNGAQRLWSFSSRCDETTPGGNPLAVGASIGFVERPGQAPVFFAASVDGKSRKDLFNVAIRIRDQSLLELKLWQPPESVLKQR